MTDDPDGIKKLITALESLHSGSEVEEQIVACGAKAVPFLKSYLMCGEPSHIYQPRQRVVSALAKLGAKEVLIEYLDTPRDIPDPVTRFGEEAVASTAARFLARWRTDDVFASLLRIATMRNLPGVMETLGSFRRPEAIPILIAALGDDVSRPAAEHALKAMGYPARKALLEVVLASPHNPEEEASPSDTLRRRSAMRILTEGGSGVEAWPALRALLHDDDVEISILASLLALNITGREDKNAAIKTLIGQIPAADWYHKMVIENGLVEHYGLAEKDIKDHVEQRMRRSEAAQAADTVLRMLLNVIRRAEGKPIDD